MPTKITRPQMDDAMLERCIEAIPAVMAGLRGNDTTQIETMRCVWCGLPLVDSKCNACFPPSKPSREAILRQAILNAVPQVFPMSAQRLGIAGTLIERAYTSWSPETFYGGALAPVVLAEFSKLEAQYAQ